MKGFETLDERIFAILEVMGIANGSGVWISVPQPSMEQVGGELWSQYEKAK